MKKEKRCSKCGKWKSFAEFSKYKQASDGLQRWCKECNKQYRNMHCEEIRKYREENREYYRRYNAEHREEAKKHSRQWYIDNREKHLERSRRYYASHREEYRKRHAEWWIRNREKQREYSQRRLALEHNAGGKFTAKDWKYLLNLYNHTCLCCGATDKPLEADHIVPLSKGGLHSITNIQPLCSSCNKQKHTKTIDYRPAQHTDSA